jgi:hypothetical protein
MDVHLRGRGGPWPKTPGIEVTGPGVPQIRLLPDQSNRVQRVDLYYCLNNDWPMSRFWRTIVDVGREGEASAGRAPFLAAGDVLFVFANVTYASGARVSSRLLRKAAAEIGGAQPTLVKQTLIDAMDTAGDWDWVPAYTDPNQEDTAFFTAWTGRDGECGFTLDPKMFHDQGKMHYDFGTRKIGDPQFRGEGQRALLIDCLADNVPESLKVRLLWRAPATSGDHFEASPVFPAVGSAVPPRPRGTWRTLHMERRQFFNKEGKTLPDWEHVEHLVLVGTNPPGKPPVFKRLRWGD